MSEPPDDPRLDRRHDLVGGAPAVFGPWQLELMKATGLRPDQTLLDLGCGTLRGGLHLIEYLDAGRYTGADPAENLLTVGRELVARAGVAPRAPLLMSLRELDALNRRYDWVLTQSVLNHLDEAGVVSVVERVSRALATGGRWVSTIRFNDAARTVDPGKPHGRRAGEFWRATTNPLWFADLLRSHSLQCSPIPGPPHPRGMDLFCATRCVEPLAR